MAEITNGHKLSAVSREISFRRFIYPKRVNSGAMTQANADREIAIFVEIEKDYRKIVKAEQPKGFFDD